MTFSTIPITDRTGALQNAKVGVDGSGNVAPAQVPIDQSGNELRARIFDAATGFTRQANTTAYAANQIVNDGSGNPLIFTGAMRYAGGSGLLISSRLTIQQATIPNASQFRLYLYQATPGTTTDAAVKPTLWADRDNQLGWVDFLQNVSLGAGNDASTFEGSLPIGMVLPLLCTSADLYGQLVALVAWTPPSAAGVRIHLRIDQF